MTPGRPPVYVLFVVGTRPEAIKMLPVIQAFRADRRIRPVIVTTGQHPELTRELFAHAGLAPDVDLGSGLPANRSLNELSAHVMKAFDQHVHDAFGDDPAEPTYPAVTFVHGDTTSAMSAALASFHRRIPVAHVEAGLRTHDTGSPFPEEMNRQVIARVAAVHFAPTEANRTKLRGEGVGEQLIEVTGNTAIDALLWARDLHAPFVAPELASLEDDETTAVVTVTAHRRENWGDGLRSIAGAVSDLASLHPEVRFVLPVHPNPVVRETLHAELDGIANVALAEPMGYLEFARLLARSRVVITDSGGIQEEAPALGVPVVVTREVTERQEGVEAGTLELVGTDRPAIVTAVTRLLVDDVEHARRGKLTNPYGDGYAAQRILDASRRRFPRLVRTEGDPSERQPA